VLFCRPAAGGRAAGVPAAGRGVHPAANLIKLLMPATPANTLLVLQVPLPAGHTGAAREPGAGMAGNTGLLLAARPRPWAQPATRPPCKAWRRLRCAVGKAGSSIQLPGGTAALLMPGSACSTSQYTPPAAKLLAVRLNPLAVIFVGPVGGSRGGPDSTGAVVKLTTAGGLLACQPEPATAKYTCSSRGERT
jgi:hypothetical protein